MKIKKRAVVSIKGGLGNQIFQLIFCNYLKSKGFKVYIDLAAYRLSKSKLKKLNMTKRSLIFPLSNFGFKPTKRALLISLKLYKKIYSFLKKDTEIETHFDGHVVSENKIGLISFFDGYWKNTKYLEENFQYLKDSLSLNSQINKSINSKSIEGSILVHIRRDDFVNNGWDLPESFYLKAIEFIENRKDVSFIDIFTDDLDWFNKSQIATHKKISKIYSPKSNSKNEIIETFANMMKYKHFIIGNSTYSYFPAYLKSDKESIVIVSEPWFRNSSHPDISKDHWIKLDY